MKQTLSNLLINLSLIFAVISWFQVCSGYTSQPIAEMIDDDTDAEITSDSILEPPPITSLRSDEDYYYLRDARNRSGAWWERFKYIPLNKNGKLYLTLGDEDRIRFEFYHNNEFGSAPKPDEFYFRFRLLPYADLHLGPYIRFFTQFQGAWSTRSEGLRNPFLDQTGFDIAQLFLDWKLPIDNHKLILRGGRQVLQYGSQRLISAGPDIRSMFDGGMIRWETGNLRIDVFAVKPVKPDFEWFDDFYDRKRSLITAYSTITLPNISSGSGIDLYYIRFKNDSAIYKQGAGPEHRHTLGLRIFGDRRGWMWDLESNFQMGDFAGLPILAASTALAFGFTFEKARYQPYIELRANAISGDRDPEDQRMGTFNAMFTTGKYFGDIGLLGPANLYNLRPNFILKFNPVWSLSGALTLFFRQSLNDGIYNPALYLLRTTRNSRSRYIGTQFESAIDQLVNRNLNFRFVYSFFIPGRFIEETGPSKTVQFVQVNAVFVY